MRCSQALYSARHRDDIFYEYTADRKLADVRRWLLITAFRLDGVVDGNAEVTAGRITSHTNISLSAASSILVFARVSCVAAKKRATTLSCRRRGQIITQTTFFPSGRWRPALFTNMPKMKGLVEPG